MHRRVPYSFTAARAVVTTRAVALALGGLFGLPGDDDGQRRSLISGIFIVPGELDPRRPRLRHGAHPDSTSTSLSSSTTPATSRAPASSTASPRGSSPTCRGPTRARCNYARLDLRVQLRRVHGREQRPKEPQRPDQRRRVLNGVYQADGSVVTVPYNLVPDGGHHEAGVPGGARHVCLSSATWVTTCSATAQASVQTLANCTPLTLETSVPSSCSLPVRIPVDGGLDAAVDAPVDATTQDAAHDATMHDAGPQLLPTRSRRTWGRTRAAGRWSGAGRAAARGSVAAQRQRAASRGPRLHVARRRRDVLPDDGHALTRRARR